jgi:hypothetical protein
MDVIPVPFVSERKHMITRCEMVLDKGSLRIHPKFEKLIVSLRTSVEQYGISDKDLTSYNDIFDAFILAPRLRPFLRFEQDLHIVRIIQCSFWHQI